MNMKFNIFLNFLVFSFYKFIYSINQCTQTVGTTYVYISTHVCTLEPALYLPASIFLCHFQLTLTHPSHAETVQNSSQSHYVVDSMTYLLLLRHSRDYRIKIVLLLTYKLLNLVRLNFLANIQLSTLV